MKNVSRSYCKPIAYMIAYYGVPCTHTIWASDKKFAWGYGKSSGPLQDRFSLKKFLDLFKVFDNVDCITVLTG